MKYQYCQYYRLNCFFIKFSNSLSDIFFLASMIMAASFPITYLKLGLSDVTACRITLATSEDGIVFCTICFNTSDILFSICLYGEKLGSDSFVATFKF